MNDTLEKNILISGKALDKEKLYWETKFSEIISFDGFPYDKKANIKGKRNFNYYRFLFPNEVHKRIVAIGNNSYSIFTMLLSGINYMIYRYTGNNNMIVGTPIFNRENNKKYLNHVLALISQVHTNISFKEYVLDLKNVIQQANENVAYSFVDKINQIRDLGSNENYPPFETMISLADIHDKNNINYCESNIYFNFEINEDELICDVNYCSERYLENTITRICNYLSNYLLAVLFNPNIKLCEIDILTESERKTIINDFNYSNIEFDRSKTIHGLFQEQVAKTPMRIAVEYSSQKITYKELDEKSNQFARYIMHKGVKNGSVVGISIPRSIDFVVAVFGILKSGAICQPIDTNYPEKRVTAMLKDSGADFLIGTTQEKFIDEIEINSLGYQGNYYLNYSKERIHDLNANPDQTAYIIFTSGSEGMPKGVRLKHIGIINHIETKNDEIDMLETDVLSHNLSFSFVASIWKIFSPLIIGAKLVIFDETIIKNAYEFFKVAEQFKVTQMEIIPSVLNIYLEIIGAGEEKLKLMYLRKIVLTGEQVSSELVNKFYKEYKIPLINAYGQSECSDDTLHYHIPYNTRTTSVPIGKPSHNTHVYILNEYKQIQPISVSGELYISGEGVADGYINRPDLTKQRFVDNPFLPGHKMYRTGDYAKWDENGVVHFITRKDQQVKIRGFRIEIKEIEFTLLKYKAVKDALVILKEDPVRGKALYAYIILKKETDITNIKNYLLEYLPDYMIPSYFISMKHFPLLPNGKIDRKALPDSELKMVNDVGDTSTTTVIEEKLKNIFLAVLNLSKIGVHDDFFIMGGNSLTATVLISRIHKEFNKQISLNDVFEMPSIRKLAGYLQQSDSTKYFEIEQVEKSKFYETSTAQKRLFILNAIEGESVKYNLPNAVEIEGKLDYQRLDNAYHELINRHETLRTSFQFLNGEPIQIIHEKVDFKIEILDAATMSYERILDNFIRPFQLEKAPLLRVGLIRLSKEKHILVYDMHHIICDGVSADIMLNELTDAYKGLHIPEMLVQYKDFCYWQNKLFQEDSLTRQKQYWLGRLENSLSVLNMPTDFTRQIKQGMKGAVLFFKLDKYQSEGMRRIANDSGATIYMVLLAVLNILLSKTTGQTDIIVGTPVAGRHHAQTENMIGNFINLLVMLNRVDNELSFTEMMSQVKQNVLEAFEHQDYPFEELVNQLNVNRDTGHNPIFDILFALHNNRKQLPDMGDMTLKPMKCGNPVSKYDITLNAIETEQEIEFNLEYNVELFKESSMLRFIEHFQVLAHNISNNSSAKIKDLSMLSEFETKQILYDFNNFRIDYPYDKTIHELFEEQAIITPNQTAIISKNKIFTYSMLQKQVHQIAAALREKGVKKGSIVAIVLYRTVDLIASILGILKAGGAYVPIDPDFPNERIEYMLKDSNTEIVITQPEVTQLNCSCSKIIYIKELKEAKVTKDALTNFNKYDDLAYILYTSGSTGVPKGVMISHRAVHNFIIGMTYKIEFNKYQNILCMTTVSFDIFVLESILPLVLGMSIILADEKEQKSPKWIAELVDKNHVDMLQATPSRIKMIINSSECENIFQKLQVLMVGGESFPPQLLKELITCYRGEIYNMYGPTESTVWSSVKKLTKDTDITIGKPIANTHIYILNQFKKLCPIGTEGEVYIAGDGVANGYYNKPALTAERFVEDPFNPGKIMFRTGDMASWTESGEIRFSGREDKQIKLRGFRIELGEIENTIANFHTIKEVIVMKQGKDENEYLVAYLVYKNNKEQTELEELKKMLHKKLPYYMIPQIFYVLGEMPMTPNGKIDQNALAEYRAGWNNNTEIEFTEAETEKEKILLNIWRDILKLDKISIHDNFFEIGGTSLRLIKMHEELNKIYPNSVELIDFFGHPTISKIAELLNSNHEKTDDWGGMKLSNEYFVKDSQDKVNILKYTVTDDILDILRLLEENSVASLKEVLIALYIYLFSQISTDNYIGVYIEGIGGEICRVGIEPEKDKITDITELIRIIANKVHNEEQIPLSSFSGSRNHNKHKVLPLFCFSKTVSSYVSREDMFDIILYQEELKNGIQLIFKYNDRKLSSQKMYHLFGGYINLINSVAEFLKN